MTGRGQTAVLSRPPFSNETSNTQAPVFNASQLILVIVATYNESQNIATLARNLMRLNLPLELLIIDDNSPDGTGRVADDLSRAQSRVRVLHRKSKEGLALALLDGFRWACRYNYRFVINMDGDQSHDPKEIPDVLRAMRSAELAIGSRYCGQLRICNWPARRLFLSKGAARYVRLLTGMPFRDPTSGFRCFSPRAIEAMDIETLCSKGYVFHIETLYRIWRRGLNVSEIPISFTNRAEGKTKISWRIIVEAIWKTWKIALKERLS